MSTQRRLKLTLCGMAEFVEGDETPLDTANLSFADPAPGVAGIEATVHAAEVSGEDLVVDVTLDPRDYIRQMVALGADDLLETLQDLTAGGLSPGDIRELITWIRSQPDFKVAVINTKGGGLDVDNWPAQPEL